MRTVLKHIVARTYKPLLVKYLSKKRIYRYDGLVLEVPPEVFHPGFFFSTQFLLNHIAGRELAGKKLLELGAGSGLISLFAAKQQALVTATDINPVAVDYLQSNSRNNNLVLTILLSDVFTSIPPQTFDIIAINPPYYKKDPKSLIDHAWYCGENGEYFIKLFYRLKEYITGKSEVLMVLCEGCDLDMIGQFADAYGFRMQLVSTRQNLLEKDFIYTIERSV